MARYSILYLDPVNAPGKKLEHALEAASDAQARIRFMNLSWVAFTAIYIDSVAVAGDQPEAAKKAAKADPLGGVRPHGYRGLPNGRNCRVCGQHSDHSIHRGFEPTVDDVPDRTNAGAKMAAASIKAAAAGITPADASPPPAPQRRAAPPPDRIPAVDWQKDVDHLTDRIGKLADRAQSLTRRGRHAEADECRHEARELAASRAAITRRNKGK